MTELKSLSELRKQYQIKDKCCPKCGEKLTIDKTEYFDTEVCESCLDHVVINSIDLCCRNQENEVRKLITSNNMIQVRNQCKNCGKVEGKSIGGLTEKERESLPVVDIALRDKGDELRQSETHEFYNEVRRLRQVIQIKDREVNSVEWWKKYKTYLMSEEWRFKRDLVLKRDDFKCQCCMDRLATQVHHKSYEFVDFEGGEPCFNLVSICTPCHEKIHNK